MEELERELISHLEKLREFLEDKNPFWKNQLDNLLSEGARIMAETGAGEERKDFLKSVDKVLNGKDQLGDLFVSAEPARSEFGEMIEGARTLLANIMPPSDDNQ